MALWYPARPGVTFREHQLAVEPLCRMCQAEGRTTAANIADHITPHRGDLDLFWHGTCNRYVPHAILCLSRARNEAEPSNCEAAMSKASPLWGVLEMQYAA
jgi:hypothetical protein